jgi:hypothetical protein
LTDGRISRLHFETDFPDAQARYFSDSLSCPKTYPL